jgi:hypothetical protein
MLAAALALAVGALAVESRRASRLAETLAGTEARLAEAEAGLQRAEARLAAYDGYLTAVRARADGLRAELEALLGALAADPAEGPPPGK